jgi:deazaflavin-dependent oxidoreductase (nitroreductase family)
MAESDRSDPTMTDRTSVQAALRRGGVIDITTTGRRSGKPRRIEIVIFDIGGRLYITGMPGRPRDWLANLAADQRMIVHLKRGMVADIPATARIIREPEERRNVLTVATDAWRQSDRLETFVASAPLIEVTPDDASLLAVDAETARARMGT